MLASVPLDTLVVLGCRVQGEKLSAAAARRVERAALAYQEHGARLVIASGGKRWDGSLEADVFSAGLVERGVAPEHILGETASLNTRGNARGVARLLRERGIVRVGLVTCDWHMARALRLFRRQGLEPVALAAPSPSVPTYRRALRRVREHGSLALDLLLSPLGFRHEA
jgi:uncharacterized SAM-binding protein YcdF (DUF218 family)